MERFYNKVFIDDGILFEILFISKSMFSEEVSVEYRPLNVAFDGSFEDGREKNEDSEFITPYWLFANKQKAYEKLMALKAYRKEKI